MTATKATIPKEDFDIFMGINPAQPVDQLAFGLIKMTFAYDASGNVRLEKPLPLYNNFFDPDEIPRLKAGCEFWPFKEGTDIALQGKAVPRDGVPVRSMNVKLQVGEYSKKVAVFGERRVRCRRAGEIFFTPPELFEQVNLSYENAYGGIDWRVPVEEPLTWTVKFQLQADHPGLYPRNHFGKGYVVLPDPEDIDGIALPCLEDPSDLLTEDRLVAGDPRLWHKQPLPWCLDWMPVFFYPRYAFFGGVDGWYPAPEDSVAEVRMGVLPRNYRTIFQESFLDSLDFDIRFFSEASYGLSVPFLEGNEPVLLQGVHPQGSVLFNLPGKPLVELYIDREKATSAPKLHSLLFLPQEWKFSMVWAILSPLPRPFVPGIHKTIPLRCRVNNGPLYEYEAPQPVEESVKAFLQQNKGNSQQ
ncbi:MAG: DUF2169 domain-containing protein [Desulfosalsimonadaceae bacterium]